MLTVLIVVSSSAFACVLALPALPLSPNLTNLRRNASSLLNPKPPQEPVCPSTERWGVTIGRPSYEDCDYVLSNLYPKDPLAKPVIRNFYAAMKDVSHTMANVRLPYEQTHGITALAILLLLATDFNNVPFDEATWNDLRGAARTVFRTCIRGKGTGGVVTKNVGKYGNIEIVVYGINSIFAKNQILKNSLDPLARSIATQELLELLDILVIPVPHPVDFGMGSVASDTANATISSAVATNGTSVALT
ncbi:hypothetical protein IMSHALPRED_005844 [Imshaugia aleurites]|uniref:Uncharacterized protein n=1 Tax=Imshaugia aleurites TaxID=172621 RepID=A0A8H3FED6_9LECA|nr:hypothetical protein IMSHALPRED_005844 [Imshaugia aleurites]